MSYDTYMMIDTGGAHPAMVCDIGNMTSNVVPMWTKALGGTSLGDLGGKLGGELIPLLERAVSHIKHPFNRSDYEAMNPENGWGSHEGAARYLEQVLEACREHPKATFEVSR